MILQILLVLQNVLSKIVMPCKKIIINEEQLKTIIKEVQQREMLEEALKMGDIKSAILKGLGYGMTTAAIIGYLIAGNYLSNQNEIQMAKQYAIDKEQEMRMYDEVRKSWDWQLAANDVHATVYNAEPKQCNADCGRTASMFRLNLNDVGSHRIIAMERTFMTSLGLNYGDIVRLEGVGEYDGVWQIQDTMNKRFAGQKKIDLLVPKSDGLNQWRNVKLYVLSNRDKVNSYKREMAPQLDKQSFAAQNKMIKNKQYRAK